MRSICEFRKSVYGPVLYRANINGRGPGHCETIAGRFASMSEYGYWQLRFNKTDQELPKIQCKHGTPYIKGTN